MRIKTLDMQGSGRMTPINRLDTGLAKLQNNECKVDSTVHSLMENYQKQANEADQRLQEKQARELEKFFG